MSSEKKKRQAVLIGVGEYDCCSDYSGYTNQLADQLAELHDSLDDGGKTSWECIPVSGKVLQADMKAKVGLAIKSKPSELLIYFTGHAFQVGEDLWLAGSDHDPYASVGEPRGVSLQWLFQTVSAVGVSVLIVILDCHGDDFVDNLVLPRNLMLPQNEETLQYAILASGSDDDHRGEFTKLLLEGLGKPVDANADQKTKNQARAKARDGLERVTPMSLAMYFESIQAIWSVKPIFRACLRRTVTMRDGSTLNLRDLDRFRSLFCDPFTPFNVNGDYECTEELSTNGAKPPRSRPSLPDLPPNPSELIDPWTQVMVDMDVFKHLRNAGYLETCERIVDPVQKWVPEDVDVFWACIHNQAVRLTPMGEIAWQYYFNQQY